MYFRGVSTSGEASENLRELPAGQSSFHFVARQKSHSTQIVEQSISMIFQDDAEDPQPQLKHDISSYCCHFPHVFLPQPSTLTSSPSLCTPAPADTPVGSLVDFEPLMLSRTPRSQGLSFGLGGMSVRRQLNYLFEPEFTNTCFNSSPHSHKMPAFAMACQ